MRRTTHSSKARKHLRANVIAYLALFFALTGSAVALPDANTVFSDDIVNGEVRTGDISNKDGVRSADVRDDTLADGGLAAQDLASESVGRAELQQASVTSAELENLSVSGADIAPETIGRLHLGTGAVGASELNGVHEHLSGPQLVTDATAHDGNYANGTETVFCGPGEQLLSVSIQWPDNNGHDETALADVTDITRRAGGQDVRDSANVRGIFDGGGGNGNPAVFEAIATCIG